MEHPFNYAIHQAMSSLIPSRQIAFSATLAATLGLEEAVLLQCLGDESELRQKQRVGRFDWYSLSADELLVKLPFWTLNDVQRIGENLRQQGVIIISSAPLAESSEFRFAFNESFDQQQSAPVNAAFKRAAPQNAAGRAQPISLQWQPDQMSLDRLAQQSVPAHFAREHTGEFVHYWSERGESHHSWGNKFVSHVIREWRKYEARQNQPIDESPWEPETERRNQPMSRNWTPSTDALEILETQAGIHRNFITDAVPEFVLYWLERGDASNTWNARFISHVKRQWAEYKHSLKNERAPSVMTADWQPSNEVYDVLRFARIDLDFAQALVPEFVIYWRDRNEMRPSWNTLFLQFAKQQWQRRSSAVDGQTTQKSLKETSFRDRLTDRSWA